MDDQIETGGTAFTMQDPQAIHAYAAARIAHINSELTEERDQAYMAARSEAVGGMTLRQYAAIHLRVPSSGTDWLDAMILEAKRDEVAAKAMESMMTQWATHPQVSREYAINAYEQADAMLKVRSAQ